MLSGAGDRSDGFDDSSLSRRKRRTLRNHALFFFASLGIIERLFRSCL
nr:MAG TPA: hypothetical protein [Caudoviricetes sp.]